MVKIIIHGCTGHMGKVVAELAAADEDICVVAGVDIADDGKAGFPVYQSIAECREQADAVVDFSSAKAIDRLLEDCTAKRLPLVLCTTGLSEEQLAKTAKACGTIPILRSANMSLGVNVLLKLLKEATKTFGPAGFDIEIVEKHHHRKLDAPSGTALALADSINEASGGQYHYVYDRSQLHQKRDAKEIGISAVRGGNIVGEHEVFLAGMDEIIEFRHTAYSRGIFAKGALEAAKFLAGKPAGSYDMADVIA